MQATGGPATSAYLAAPGPLAVDPNGDLLISDMSNYRADWVAGGPLGPPAKFYAVTCWVGFWVGVRWCDRAFGNLFCFREP